MDWHIIHDRAPPCFGRDHSRHAAHAGRRTSVSSALELGALLIESSEKDIVATRK